MSRHFYGLSRYLFFGQDLFQDQLSVLHSTVIVIQQETTSEYDCHYKSFLPLTNILQLFAVEGGQSKGTRISHSLQITSELLQG